MILYFFWRIECERVSATRLHQKLRGGWEERRRRWSWTFSGARAPPLPSKTRKERACRRKEAISERQERESVTSVPSSRGPRSSGGSKGTAGCCTARDPAACRGSRSSGHWSARRLDAGTPPAWSWCRLHTAWCTGGEENGSDLHTVWTTLRLLKSVSCFITRLPTQAGKKKRGNL